MYVNRYSNLREVTGRHKLKPGHYVIVPTTDAPNIECEFLIRIFSEQLHQMKYVEYKSISVNTYLYCVRVLVQRKDLKS